MRKTVDEIMAAEPCKDYPRGRVEELVGDGIDEDQLLHLDIPREDVLWGLIYVFLTPQQVASLACDCAERSLNKERREGREPDQRSWDAVAVARRYLAGDATNKEMDDAIWDARAARDAAGDADDDWGAVWDAVWAARDAAMNAARAAKAAKAADRAANAAVMDVRNAWTVACWDAVWAARDAARSARDAARSARDDTRTVEAAAAELEWQIKRALLYVKEEDE